MGLLLSLVDVDGNDCTRSGPATGWWPSSEREMAGGRVQLGGRPGRRGYRGPGDQGFLRWDLGWGVLVGVCASSWLLTMMTGVVLSAPFGRSGMVKPERLERREEPSGGLPFDMQRARAGHPTRARFSSLMHPQRAAWSCLVSTPGPVRFRRLPGSHAACCWRRWLRRALRRPGFL